MVTFPSHKFVEASSSGNPGIAKLSQPQQENITMAMCASLETPEQLGNTGINTTAQGETHKAILLVETIPTNSNNMGFCETVKVAQLNKMIDADTKSFLDDLDTFLTYKSIYLLLHNELFKDMLYQRYQQLGWNLAARILDGEKPDELSKLTKEEIIDLFRKTETSLARKRELLASGKLSLPSNNDRIPRRESYPEYWAGNESINTNNGDICHCSHGSGFRYLQNILLGLHHGSKLEHQEAHGIQVHPNDCGLDLLKFYARRSESYFDTPAIITFDIEAQYLDGQPNAYEAGLRCEFLSHASNFKFENVFTGKVIKGESLDKIQAEILKRKIGIGNF